MNQRFHGILSIGICILGIGVPFSYCLEKGPIPRTVDHNGDEMPSGAKLRLGSLRFRHPGMSNFTILNDKTTIASIGEDSKIRFWNLSTGLVTKIVSIPDFIDTPFHTVFISQAGSKIAILGEKRVSIIDLNNENHLSHHNMEDGIVDCLAFSPDDNHLLIGFDGSRVVSISLQSKLEHKTVLGKNLVEPRFRSSWLRLTFTPDGTKCIVGGIIEKSSGLTVIDSKSLKTLSSLNGRIDAEAISPDGNILVTAGPTNLSDERSTIKIYELLKKDAHKIIHLSHGCLSAAFSPDGRFLACSGNDFGSLVEISSGKTILRFPNGSGYVFSPSGKQLLRTDGFQLVIWDIMLRQFSPLSSPILWRGRTVFSPDSTVLASLGKFDGVITIWNLVSGTISNTLYVNDYFQDASITFSPDGNRLIVSKDFGRVSILDWKSGELLEQFHLGVIGIPREHLQLYLSQSGKRLSAIFRNTKSKKCFLLIFDLLNRSLHKFMELDYENIVFSQWITDDLLSISDKNGFDIIDIQSMKRIRHVSSDSLCVLSNDGQLLITTSGFDRDRLQNEVHVCDVYSAKEIFHARVSSGTIRTAAFSLKHKSLLVSDGTVVHAFNIVTGQLNFKIDISSVALSGKLSSIKEIVVSRDGNSFVTLHENAPALLWDIHSLLQTHSNPAHKKVSFNGNRIWPFHASFADQFWPSRRGVVESGYRVPAAQVFWEDGIRGVRARPVRVPGRIVGASRPKLKPYGFWPFEVCFPELG